MPRRGREALREQTVFFVTTTVENWKPVFRSFEQLNSLRSILVNVVRKYEARIYGYVLMPHHLHLLVELRGGGPRLSQFMKDLKSISSRQILAETDSRWMPRYDDVAIYSEKQFQRKLGYIHNNPVRAGLADSPEDYEFSSAGCWSGRMNDQIVTTSLNWSKLSGEDT